jgi:hypothetical protein
MTVKPICTYQETNRRGLMVCIIISLVMLFMPAHDISAEGYEIPGNRSASDILPTSMLVGPHHRIQNKVVSYGYMHHYTVDSDFGRFEVTGDGALRKLLKEINAIARLREVKKSKAYGEAVKNAGKMPFEFGKNLITDPVDTVTGVPKGVFQLFGNAYTSITKSKDPSEDSKAKQLLAVSSYKRDYAYELGIDVYSSNPVLQEELNSLGWAGALGSLSMSAALAPLGGPGVKVFKASRLSQQLNDLLKEEPPSRLRKINEKKLLAMHIPKHLVEEFLNSPVFTPRHDTVIAGSLESLRGARGRDALINFALTASDEESANFFQNIAEIMKGYYYKVSTVKEIDVVSGYIIAKAKNGSILIPFPLDHGVWTERADRVISNLVASVNKSSGKNNTYELWATGTVSPKARKQLKSLGFKVTENVDELIEFMD